MFKAKKKPQVIEEIEEEEEEEEEEEDDEEEVPAPKAVKKVDPNNKQITKEEVADVIEGNLNRALHLLQFLRQ